jgi:ABC-type multidrug transport system ATPase subunit
MLRVEDLDVSFGSHVALRRVSCGSPAGSVVALLGPNGAGKSTLIRAVAGVLLGATQSGSIRSRQSADGHEPAAYCPDAGIGFLDLTPEQNVELLVRAMRLSPDERDERFRTAMRVLDLSGTGSVPLGDLSFGTRRRLDLVLTFCKSAFVYLFDEPYNGLDAAWVRRFSVLLRGVAESGRTAIVATHAVELLLPVADVVWELDAGFLVHELRSRPGAIRPEQLLSLPADADEPARLPWLERPL